MNIPFNILDEILMGAFSHFVNTEDSNKAEFVCEELSVSRVWDQKYVNGLPDAAFALVKTTDGKKVRKLPHHNDSVKSGGENNSVDLPHLKNGLARAPQMTGVTEDERGKAIAHLRRHAVKLLKNKSELSSVEKLVLNEMDKNWAAYTPVVKIFSDLSEDNTALYLDDVPISDPMVVLFNKDAYGVSLKYVKKNQSADLKISYEIVEYFVPIELPEDKPSEAGSKATMSKRTISEEEFEKEVILKYTPKDK